MQVFVIKVCILTVALLAEECKGCGDRLGMEDGSIPDSRITASSRFTASDTDEGNDCQPSKGRLNNPGSGAVTGGWCPAEYDKEAPWLQVDLVEKLQVEGVIIQGSVDHLERWTEQVTAYQVQYRDDQSNWINVTTPGTDVAQTFPGNTDLTTPVTNMFDQPIQARFIRIKPTAYYNWPSMRAELIGCKAE